MLHLCTSPQLFDDEYCFTSFPPFIRITHNTFYNPRQPIDVITGTSSDPLCTCVLNRITQPLTSSLASHSPHVNLLQFNLASQTNPLVPNRVLNWCFPNPRFTSNKEQSGSHRQVPKHKIHSPRLATSHRLKKNCDKQAAMKVYLVNHEIACKRHILLLVRNNKQWFTGRIHFKPTFLLHRFPVVILICRWSTWPRCTQHSYQT
jgi:hypothetical protein